MDLLILKSLNFTELFELKFILKDEIWAVIFLRDEIWAVIFEILWTILVHRLYTPADILVNI